MTLSNKKGTVRLDWVLFHSTRLLQPERHDASSTCGHSSSRLAFVLSVRFFSSFSPCFSGPTITTLKCYVCNENENAACADETALAKFATECQEKNEPYCRKISQTVNGKNTVVRTCGSKTGSKSCYKTAGKNNVSRSTIDRSSIFFFV